MSENLGFGVDIGGTGIKGGVVDLSSGELVGERFRIDTPHPAEPEAVEGVVAEVVEHFSWKGSIGVTFPGIMREGTAWSAANMGGEWIGRDVDAEITKRLGVDVTTLNDADAAGMAEMRYGAGRGRMGNVLMLTFGTGIGSALFLDGKLVPNTELGHIEVGGKDAERLAAASVKEKKGLSYAQWAGRVSQYLEALEKALWVDLIIVGGGPSAKAHKWVPLLSTRTPVVPALLMNEAGIVGAALAARGG